MSAMSRLENQKAFVMIAVRGTENDCGGGAATGVLDEAFDIAMIKCSRRTFVLSLEFEDRSL